MTEERNCYMNKHEKLLVFGLSLVVVTTFFLVFFIGLTTPAQYFVLGVFGGGMAALCYYLGKFTERLTAQNDVDDLFHRLQTHIENSVNKIKAYDHSGSYVLGYSMAMRDVQAGIRRERRRMD